MFSVSKRNGLSPRIMTCINDGQAFPLSRASRAQYVASLETAVAHAILLKGAIAQFADLDIDP